MLYIVLRTIEVYKLLQVDYTNAAFYASAYTLTQFLQCVYFILAQVHGFCLGKQTCLSTRIEKKCLYNLFRPSFFLNHDIFR